MDRVVETNDAALIELKNIAYWFLWQLDQEMRHNQYNRQLSKKTMQSLELKIYGRSVERSYFYKKISGIFPKKNPILLVFNYDIVTHNFKLSIIHYPGWGAWPQTALIGLSRPKSALIREIWVGHWGVRPTCVAHWDSRPTSVGHWWYPDWHF